MTTYSRVKPTEVLPVNSEVHPLVNLAPGPTDLLDSMDGSLLGQLLYLAASAYCSTRERTPMPTAYRHSQHQVTRSERNHSATSTGDGSRSLLPDRREVQTSI